MTVAVGALLTLFQLTIKAATSIFISLNDYLLTTRSGYKWLKICCITKQITKKKLKHIRRLLATIVFAIEISFLGMVVSLTLSYFTGVGYTTTEKYISEHGNQALLMFGIVTTCLLLPIEEYAETTPTQQFNQVVNQNNFSGNERYQTNCSSNESLC